MKKEILVILIVSILMVVSFVGRGIAYSTNGNAKYDPCYWFHLTKNRGKV